MKSFRMFDRAAVEARLDYRECIAAIRKAMRHLSVDQIEQPLRQIEKLGEGKLFALMPGISAVGESFGVKIVTAFSEPGRPGRSVHRGLVVSFDPDSGEVAAIGDAGAITEIRTACATSVATDALANPDASSLGLFGCGALARTHLRALPLVRPIATVRVWGRDIERTRAFVAEMTGEADLQIEAVEDPRLAAACDIVTTITGATEPVLFGDWVRPGTHVNIVGSSYAGPVEIDNELLLATRYIVDSRRSALVAAAEFLRARDAGLVDERHIAAEIGEVLAGKVIGRENVDQITLYKSLGHVVQDLAALDLLARNDGGMPPQPEFALAAAGQSTVERQHAIGDQDELA